MENNFNKIPKNKVDEYKQRYLNGESVESFGDIPESWKKEILNSKKELISEDLTKAGNLEEIKEALESVSKDNFIFTHITAPDVAKNIYENNFVYNLGTGLSGTMSFTGSDGAINQIDKILKGESPHRNLTGMFILAIPKKLVENYAGERRIGSNSIEDFLMDNYDSMASGIIPKEFNFGYLDQGVLYYNSKYK